MIRVTIDGAPIDVKEGASVLDAIHAAGLEIPTACHDPRLEPTGSCRLCLVRLEGVNRPVTACALKAQDGMTVVVDDPDLNESRRAQIEMLAQNYPPELVDQFPEKSFHQWLRTFGLTPGGTQRGQIDTTNPYFRFDPEACIKCFRCVRICDEVQGSFVWQVMDRGEETHVIPDSMGPLSESTCKSCGACVDACPTAALVDKTREESGQPTAWTRTTCPYCGVGCELSVGTREGRMVQVLPVLEAPVNKGHLCVKGRYAHQYVYAPDRVTTPLIRRKGVLEPATWDEAISLVASEFQRLIAAHGPNSLGVLGSARAPNEDNYLAQKFARVVVGTNNVDCCARVCHGPTAAAMKATLGTGAATNSYDDIEKARTFLVIGSNPSENHPIVGERIKQAVLDGANLIVIDPRRIELAQHANVHVALRPGTNVPLLHAMAHVILEEGLADSEFLATRVAEVDEFRAFVSEWTPERAGEVCGVEPETIRQAARLYATAKPTMAFHGLGMTEHIQGTEGVMCLVNLALITGNLGKPGAGINPLRGQNNVQGSAHMGCEPSNLTGFVSLDEGRERFGAIWQAPVPETKGLNLMQMLEAVDAGTFKGLWAIGYDVVFTVASAADTRRRFEGMEFVVVQDLFLNETAREFAHVFLPACSSFERDGTFMNAERRVQRVHKAIEPVGDSKPDWEIIQLVADAMDHTAGTLPAPPTEDLHGEASMMPAERTSAGSSAVAPLPQPLSSATKPAESEALAGAGEGGHAGGTPAVRITGAGEGGRTGFSFRSAEEIWEEVRKVWTPGGGMSYARLEQAGLQWPCPTEDHPGTQILHRERFPIGERAALKRVEYVPTPEVTSSEFPFILNTGRTLYHFNAGTMTARTRNQELRPSDTLDMHPDDAITCGIAAGERARVISHYGEATLPVRLDSGLRRGEVFATFHSREIFLNLVTSPRKDRIVGAPEYKVTAVRVEPA
ncbi:MAG: molybdopterin-dependent oxidoreductase [Fimbriimonadaceae bacterium]|nr:molybdopterin-dependent oxidoreductase [Fimbriimonadaceae bacterium]